MKHKRSTMEFLVSCVAFGMLFLASIIPATTADSTIKPLVDFQNYKAYDINHALILGCNVTLDPAKNYDLEWLKNDKPLSAEPILKDRYKIIREENKLVIHRSNEDDYGNYTCRIVGTPELSATMQVVSKPTARLPPNTGVVEGEKLTINCVVHGKPTPDVYWVIGENDTYTESRDRVTLTANTAGVPNAALVIAEARREDRGEYRCVARNIASQDGEGDDAVTFVRVKDKLAALWPFLGICAEVFILCTIILVYEKRRNKPELEESDTDQSPDPKKS